MRSLGAVLILVSFAACNPKFPECKTDADCKAAENNGGALLCLTGQCRQCGKDADCAAGKVCKDFVCGDKTVATPAPSSGSTLASSQATLCKTDDECDPASLCIRGQCVKATSELPECTDVRVHFDLDKSELSDEDKTTLQGRVRCFRNNKGLHVTIEGHADERGTEDYNLALGSRRATTVAKYLEALGVNEEQVKTLSYGFERPVCTEHDEACWAKNRRGEVKPQR